MDGNSQEFLQAVENVKKLTALPSDDDLLKLYGFYKQATIGDINTPKPGMFDRKGKAKWDAWNDCKGLECEAAEASYIKYVEQLTA